MFTLRLVYNVHVHVHVGWSKANVPLMFICCLPDVTLACVLDHLVFIINVVDNTENVHGAVRVNVRYVICFPLVYIRIVWIRDKRGSDKIYNILPWV